MTADYQLELTLIGELEDIKKMVEVFVHYSTRGDRDAYFNFIDINGKHADYGDDKVDMENVTDELIAAITVGGEVKIEACGPFGYYCELNEVGLFREMAEAAPNAKFVAEISGSQTYAVQNLKCALEGGKLSITTFFQSNDEASEAWREDFEKKLPLKKFKKLFKVSGEDINERSYYYVVRELECIFRDGFEQVSLEGFVLAISCYQGETELDEDRFKEIMEKELPALGILNPFEFEDKYDWGETNEYVYDPVTKIYEGKAKPLFDGRGPIVANDVIAAGLRAQGLPDDEDSIANLSIDEALTALAAALYGSKVAED